MQRSRSPSPQRNAITSNQIEQVVPNAITHNPRERVAPNCMAHFRTCMTLLRVMSSGSDAQQAITWKNQAQRGSVLYRAISLCDKNNIQDLMSVVNTNNSAMMSACLTVVQELCINNKLETSLIEFVIRRIEEVGVKRSDTQKQFLNELRKTHIAVIDYKKLERSRNMMFDAVMMNMHSSNWSLFTHPSNYGTALINNSNINTHNSNGLTLLHIAIASNNLNLLQALLKNVKGVNVNLQATCDDRNTPLHLAIILNRPDMVKLLISHAANPNINNADGIVPLALAKALELREIVEILEQQVFAETTNNHPI